MGKKVFLRADISHFRALKLGLFSLCPFSKPFGCIIFLKFLRGGWNIQKMRNVYNIEPDKLLCFYREDSFVHKCKESFMNRKV